MFCVPSLCCLLLTCCSKAWRILNPCLSNLRGGLGFPGLFPLKLHYLAPMRASRGPCNWLIKCSRHHATSTTGCWHCGRRSANGPASKLGAAKSVRSTKWYTVSTVSNKCSCHKELVTGQACNPIESVFIPVVEGFYGTRSVSNWTLPLNERGAILPLAWKDDTFFNLEFDPGLKATGCVQTRTASTHFCSRKFSHWYSLDATCFSL